MANDPTDPPVTTPLTCCPGAAETWAPVPGWPHWASDHGRYASRTRVLKTKNLNRPENGPPFYQLVTLCANGRKLTVTAHRVTLIAHRGPCCDGLADVIARTGKLGPCPNGHETRHAHDIPDDNHLRELSWGDAIDNAIDKTRQARYSTAEAQARRRRGAEMANAIRRARREQDIRDLQSPSRLRRWLRSVAAHRPKSCKRPGQRRVTGGNK